MKGMRVTTEYRIGIDIGGTFTDFTVFDGASGKVHVEKTLTTPEQPERGVRDGIDRLAARLPSLLAKASDVIHATTLVTNVVLERKGAKTGLLTTEGFRDILEMMREDRYNVFDLFIRFPMPLVPRHLRIGVTERTLANGSVVREVSAADVGAAAALFRQHGVEAVAICFLHGYRNPANELKAAELLRREMPDIEISLSHEVLPEPKEFERTSTTVIDAYVKRVVSRYVARLAEELAADGYRNTLLLMLSNGGTATAETAQRYPVQVLESGPAAGVEAASFYGRLLGINNVLAFDMGGTTAKLCIVENGKAARTRTYEVARVHRFTAGSGYPVAIPVYDLLEIGAGGGSIARVNNLGLVQVGPDSAGSVPGPVCYGRGGASPTITDADLLLGYLNADYFLGGDMKLDPVAAAAVMEKEVAAPAKLSVAAAAAGIHDLVNETMASAARIYITDKGKSAGDLTLVASGGAGAVHAVGLARKLGVPTVVVPPFSGVLSSLGLLVAPIAFERSRTINLLLTEVVPDEIVAAFERLEEQASAVLPDRSAAVCRRTLDMRYAGQDHALQIDIPNDGPGATDIAAWRKAFLEEYENLYGTSDDNPIELAAIRVQVMQPVKPIAPSFATRAEDAKPKAIRSVYGFEDAAYRDISVFERAELRIGQVIEGPAVVEERESTTIIAAGDRLVVNELGCLVVTLAPAVAQPANASNLNFLIGASDAA